MIICTYIHTYIKHFNLLENPKRIFQKKKINFNKIWAHVHDVVPQAAWWEGPGGSGCVQMLPGRLQIFSPHASSDFAVIWLRHYSGMSPCSRRRRSRFSSGLSATNNADKTGAGAARRAADEVAERHSAGEKKESGKEEGRRGAGGLLASRVKGQGPLKQHFGRLKLTAITSRTHSHTLRLTQRQNGLGFKQQH